MKKNGFTLVELLAVIAILALLVIIALPNVINMFTSAKKSIFITDLKEVHNMATQDWIKDNLTSSGTVSYTHIKGTCTSCKELSGTVKDNLEYQIVINSSGKITDFYATDGDYQYGYTGDGLSKSDIKEEEVYLVAEIKEIDPDDIDIPKMSNTVLVINEHSNNIKDAEADFQGTPGFHIPSVVVTYYYGNTVVGIDMFTEGRSNKIRDAYSCPVRREFNGWVDNETYTNYNANHVLTEVEFNNIVNRGSIKLYAQCVSATTQPVIPGGGLSEY